MSGHTNASKHYAHYPDVPVHAPWAAYGFRPFFLILPWFVFFMMALWGAFFGGLLPWYLPSDPISWHVYELMYGMGMAGVGAFILTGVPELFPGVVPIVGRKLLFWVGLWLAGRISFFFAFGFGLWISMAINLAFSLLVVAWVFKPIVLDPLQRHASIAYIIAGLMFLQVWFYVAIAGFGTVLPIEILKLALGGFMMLIILALRRINMEAINEVLEHADIDDVFVAKPFRYNLAVFTISLFTVVEFFYPNNSVLAWLGFGAGAAILGIISDFKLDFSRIIFMPIPFYLALICITMALGYMALGADVLWQIGESSSFRHLLTTGAFGLAFIVALLVITMIHTGRALAHSMWMAWSIGLVLVATFSRTAIAFYPEYYHLLNSLAVITWAAAFLIYFMATHRILRTSRID
ncbi:MAG: NnrS family protein, partial [Campylobacteraceae bacterium]|nr:NnrS family protein [Campylobacteraceae bacterium]